MRSLICTIATAIALSLAIVVVYNSHAQNFSKCGCCNQEFPGEGTRCTACGPCTLAGCLYCRNPSCPNHCPGHGPSGPTGGTGTPGENNGSCRDHKDDGKTGAQSSSDKTR